MKYFIVDAFADKNFEGNPAGVCVMDKWLPFEVMEKIAVENNLSETAFAVKEGDTYGLRWFTPAGEIDLCGHATFGTAYILFNFYEKESNVINFYTKKVGHNLTVRRDGKLLEMNFPTIVPEKYELYDYMSDAFGAVPLEVFKTERDLFFLFDSEDVVREMKPDFSKIKAFPIGLSAHVTAKSKNEKIDFVVRSFWPKIKVNEDPVCGAAYCCLIPFWRDRLGKEKMTARQVSERGGTVYCEYDGERVRLGGRGRLYLEGDINIE
ncbi:PhzF family phenazine biosynthesis protein [Clostridium sp. E02]|uniref:PhzF family phenazine biosynthesis protein n=1 Tax=Clostridium sp. E02 TaxID=2487134 RepID=UPI000F53FCD3|nr:PhzF family phenazine biosynthesis protein [Clostridium sp. E02]